jgi:phosphate:Na+ symporter
MLPLSKPMVRFLDKRFVTQEEIESRPRYLDKTVAVSPELAIHALALELSRITTIARRMGLQVLSSEFVPSVRIRRDYLVTQKLSAAVAEFIAQLERGRLGKEVSEQLAKVVRSEQHLLASANQAMEIIGIQARVKNLTDEKLIGGIAQFRAEVVSLMKISNPEEADFSFAECELQLDRVQSAYDEVKSELLQAGAELRVPIHVVIDIIDQNSCIRRMARQMVKAMHYLSELSMIAEVKTIEPEPEPAETGTEVEQDEMLP